MRLVDQFPSDVIELETEWITLSDGARLAAKLWLPREAQPVPAILDVTPYRRRDERAIRDSMNYRYLAGHGYACVRVDMRGSGDSDGVQTQMIQASADRRDDVEQMIAWAADQPWCSGAVGMIGLSWGGNNAMFAAAKQPPALKAVVAVSFTSDSFGHGMLRKGSCLLNGTFVWPSTLAAYHTRPPDPEVVGSRWRDIWLERLAGHLPQGQFFLGHQRRDSYWDTRTLSHPERIVVPAMMMGGWADSNYTNTIGDLMPRLGGPRRAVIGAWGHMLPHMAKPGPGIGFLQEVVRWFDQHLKAMPAERESEPACQVFMREDLPTTASDTVCPGRWIAEQSWPSPETTPLTFNMTAGGLSTRTRDDVPLTTRSPQTLGLMSGEASPLFAYADGPELPGDQREDDGKSLCFDTAPLDKRIEIVGTPLADLDITVDQPVAFICCRLCDVKPDGTSARVSYGFLHLTRRDDDRNPAPIEPGKRYRVTLRLDDTAYAFRPGHRIRLALSTTYWPMVWPSPKPVALTVFTGSSALVLPERHPRSGETPSRDLGSPEAARPLASVQTSKPHRSRQLRRDVGTGETVLTLSEDNGGYRIEAHGLQVSSKSLETRSIVEGEPGSARMSARWTWCFSRGDWSVRTESWAEQWCSETQFFIRGGLAAFEGESRIYDRDWSFEFARDLL